MMWDFVPSSADRWVNCPGSIKLQQPYKGFYERSETAKEGDAAHWVIEQKRANKPVKIGDLSPHGVAITDEMTEGADLMLSTIPPGSRVETRINCDIISPGMVGRIDADHFEALTGMLTIVDYKFGHRPVEVYRNWQLLVEAIVLCHENPAVKNITFIIVQPRLYGQNPVSTWCISREELMNTYFPAIKNAADEVKSENPEVNTGSQCAFCPARHACKALEKVTLSIVDMTGDAATLDLDADATGSELALMQDAQERIKARISGLEQMALVHMGKGHPVKHFSMEPQRGKTDWKVSAETVYAMGDLMGIDLRKTVPITPTQAAKAGLDQVTVKSLSETHSGGNKLKRIAPGKLEKVFKQ